MRGTFSSCGNGVSQPEQLIKQPTVVCVYQVITPTNVAVVDEYLGHRSTPAALMHFLLKCLIGGYFVLLVADAFGIQQRFCTFAKWAIAFGVDIDSVHSLAPDGM